MYSVSRWRYSNVFLLLPYTALFIPLYPLIISYAILRAYRLMDIRLVITRGVFVAVYTFILGIPFVLAFGLSPGYPAVVGFYWWMLPSGADGDYLPLSAPLFISIWIKRQKSGYLGSRGVIKIPLNRHLRMSRIRDPINCLLVVHIISRSVRISYVGIYLWIRKTAVRRSQPRKG